jgi:hypothetical protein
VFCCLKPLPLALAVSFLLPITFGGPASAAEGSAACGTSVKEAIASAEKSLGQTQGQSDALHCIVDALKQLEATQVLVRRGPDNHLVLHAPDAPKGSAKPK